ncbi:MAG TPA: DUF3280 domain-containing protein [Acetobacteraceae bacterium]|nr:DUF3280 domain-containing protein [Acetobacteraceae bacterium]
MTAPASSQVLPTLLVLPLDLVDTSGEMPPRTEEHEARLAALASWLSQAFADQHAYRVLDPAPIAGEVATARSAQPLSGCNGCEQDLGKKLHADRVLVGELDKISTLIGDLTLRVSDVHTGQIVFARTVSFRGDTDEAWQHAARSLVRDMVQVQQR